MLSYNACSCIVLDGKRRSASIITKYAVSEFAVGGLE